jgi:hypothetical protein
MLRFFVIACAGLALVSAACGGDDAGKPTATGPGADGSAIASASSAAANTFQPTVVDVPIPTPTKVPADGIVLQVTTAKADSLYRPTVDKFRSLPQSNIQAGDKSYSGVNIQALADQVKAKPESVVTIQGVRGDGKRITPIRYPLSEIASTTVLTIDESNHLALVSSSIPQDQWLTSIEFVTFQ